MSRKDCTRSGSLPDLPHEVKADREIIRFCIQSDTSRISDADKLIFKTIAQYSKEVPVLVVGTKIDKIQQECYPLVTPELLQELSKSGQKQRQAELTQRVAQADENFKLALETLKKNVREVEHCRDDAFCFVRKGKIALERLNPC